MKKISVLLVTLLLLVSSLPLVFGQDNDPESSKLAGAAKPVEVHQFDNEFFIAMDDYLYQAHWNSAINSYEMFRVNIGGKPTSVSAGTVDSDAAFNALLNNKDLERITAQASSAASPTTTPAGSSLVIPPSYGSFSSFGWLSAGVSSVQLITTTPVYSGQYLQAPDGLYNVVWDPETRLNELRKVFVNSEGNIKFSDDPVLKLNNFQIWDLASEDSVTKKPSEIKMLPAELTNADTKKILDEISKNPSLVSLSSSLPPASPSTWTAEEEEDFLVWLDEQEVAEKEAGTASVSGSPSSSASSEPAYDPKSGVVVSGAVAKSGSVPGSTDGVSAGVTITGPSVVAQKKSIYALVLSDGRVVRIQGKPGAGEKIVIGKDVDDKIVEVDGNLFRKLSDAENNFLSANNNAHVAWVAAPLDSRAFVLQATLTELSGDSGKQSGRILFKRSDESYREQIFKEGEVVSDVETLYDTKGSPKDFVDDTRIVKKYYGIASDALTSSVTYRGYVVNGDGVNVGFSEEPLEAKLPSGIVLNYNSGKLFDSAGNEVKELLGLDDKAFYAEVKSLHRKYVVREVLDDLRFYGTEYSGIAAFSSLFIPEEFLQSWQKTIENAFCKSIIGGGADCWTSKVCQKYDDSIAGYGVLTTASESGYDYGSVPVAHIESERSLPAIFQNGSTKVQEFLYKITYYVRNPAGDEDLRYNLIFLPRGYQAFAQAKLLKPGQSGSAAGQASIVQYSRRLYTKVCLVFDHEITDARGEKVSEVCNNICGGVINPESGECNALETAVWAPNIPLSDSSRPVANQPNNGDFQNF